MFSQLTVICNLLWIHLTLGQFIHWISRTDKATEMLECLIANSTTIMKMVIAAKLTHSLLITSAFKTFSHNFLHSIDTSLFIVLFTAYFLITTRKLHDRNDLSCLVQCCISQVLEQCYGLCCPSVKVPYGICHWHPAQISFTTKYTWPPATAAWLLTTHSCTLLQRTALHHWGATLPRNAWELEGPP